MKKIKVFFAPLPEDIRGLCDPNIVLINSALSEKEKRRVLLHELTHLYLKHHDQLDRDIRDIEKECNEYVDNITEEHAEFLLSHAIYS